jgi:hypothetical protein
MTYRGVEFTVSMTAVPDIWKWQFQIGPEVKSGKTEAKLQLLAVRRVQSQIDRVLRKLAHAEHPGASNRSREAQRALQPQG